MRYPARICLDREHSGKKKREEKMICYRAGDQTRELVLEDKRKIEDNLPDFLANEAGRFSGSVSGGGG